MQKILKIVGKFFLATFLVILVALGVGLLLYRLLGVWSFFLYLVIVVFLGIRIFRILRLPI